MRPVEIWSIWCVWIASEPNFLNFLPFPGKNAPHKANKRLHPGKNQGKEPRHRVNFGPFAAVTSRSRPFPILGTHYTNKGGYHQHDSEKIRRSMNLKIEKI